MMTQEWVDRLLSAENDAPDVIGRNEADDKKDAWALRYCARFVELGLSLSFALESYRGADEHDYDSDPVEAADSEMAYMNDDGDPLI